MKDKPTDIQIAMFWAEHIQNPCSIEVNGKIENIREFYLRNVQKVLSGLTNPFAKKYLENIINQYD